MAIVVTYSTAGTFQFTWPVGVTSVLAECWGAGGSGCEGLSGSGDGAGGGAGEYAAQTISSGYSVGTQYAAVVPPAITGTAGTGTAGASATFTVGSTVVTAHGGGGGGHSSTTGTGGTGSGNTTHHDGGAGGSGAGNLGHGSGGGGSSGCPTAAGNVGGPGSGSVAGTGGASAGTDSGPGGNGAVNGAGNAPASGPGGGGGGGSGNGNAGGSSWAGQVRLTYTQTVSGTTAVTAKVPAVSAAAKQTITGTTAVNARVPTVAVAASERVSTSASVHAHAPGMAAAGAEQYPVAVSMHSKAAALTGALSEMDYGSGTLRAPVPAVAAVVLVGVNTTFTAALRPPPPAVTVLAGESIVNASAALTAPRAVPHAAVKETIYAAIAITARAPVVAIAGVNHTPQLILSLAAAPGIDQWGNQYPAGLGVSAGAIDGTTLLPGSVNAQALINGIIVPGIVDTTELQSSVLLLYTGAPGLGNLFYSNSPGPGTDPYGNSYGQGETYYSVEDLTSILQVMTPLGQVIAAVDTSGNISGQQVSAAGDVIVGGLSLSYGVIPAIPQGIINTGWTPAGSWPATAIGNSETALLELDQALSEDRTYRVRVPPVQWQMQSGSGPAYLLLSLRATTDGSVPGTGSALLAAVASACPTAANPAASAGLEVIIQPGSDANYRFLVTGLVNTGTFKFTDTAGPLAIYIEDLGLTTVYNDSNNGLVLGSGTGGGSGSKQTYNNTYYPVHTYSYYGSDAVSPLTANGLATTDDGVFQGNLGLGSGGTSPAVGNQVSYLLLPWSTIMSDLSGATVNSVALRLACTAVVSATVIADIGYNTLTSYGSTQTPPTTDADLVQHSMSAGQTATIGLPLGWGSLLAAGSIRSLQLGAPPKTSGGGTSITLAACNPSPEHTVSSYTTNPSTTSQSFSPPAGTLVVAMVVYIQDIQSTRATDGANVADSLGNSYTEMIGNSYYGFPSPTLFAGLYYHYYTVNRSDITVHATGTGGGSDSGTIVLTIQCYDNAAASQPGATTTGGSWTNSTMEENLTTTQAGSLVIAAGGIDNIEGGQTYTPPADFVTILTTLTTDNSDNQAYLFGNAAALTGTPGSMTAGWQVANGYVLAPWSLAVAEILPAASPPADDPAYAGSWYGPEGSIGLEPALIINFTK